MITSGKITLITKSYTNDDIITLTDLKLLVFKMLSVNAPTLTDTELTLYRNEAIELVETLTNTMIISSEYKCNLYGFHNNTDYMYNSKGLIIKKPFIKEITKIEYIPNTNINLLTELTADYYFVEYKQLQSYINFIDNKQLPEVYQYSMQQLKPNAVQISFKSGLFYDKNNVENILKSAIADYVIHKYQGCGEDYVKSLANAISKYCYISYSNWFEI